MSAATPPNDPHPLSSATEAGATDSRASEATTTIALIGATPVAQQIAAQALPARLNVIIDDISDARLQALSLNLEFLVRAEEPLALNPEGCAPSPQDQSGSRSHGSSSPLATLLLTQSIESAIRSADFIIDTLPDDLEVKLELFTLFDKFARPNAIFITTGTIPIDDLAEITFCPDRCIAVHLNSRASDKDTRFRLVAGTQTSSETLASTSNLFARMCGFHIA